MSAPVSWTVMTRRGVIVAQWEQSLTSVGWNPDNFFRFDSVYRAMEKVQRRYYPLYGPCRIQAGSCMLTPLGCGFPERHAAA